jgi:hypothetical protein
MDDVKLELRYMGVKIWGPRALGRTEWGVCGEERQGQT